MNAGVISGRDAYRLMLRNYPGIMNIQQMSELLGISIKTGYKLLQDGKIACIKVGRSYRIPKSNVFSYLKIGNNLNPE